MNTARSGALEYLSESGWVARPSAAGAEIDGDLRCDVVVVGGGICGMAASLQLARRGIDVVLLESDVCGWGASSRNSGFLTNTVAVGPQLLATMYRHRIRELVGFADSAVRFAEDLMSRLAIDCDYAQTGIVRAAVTPAQLRSARHMAKVLAAAGAQSEFVDGRDAGLPPAFIGGIRERIGGELNPGKYCLGLRQAVIASDARVFEQTPVGGLQETSSGVTVSVPRGRVRAQRVLMATNAYSEAFEVTPRNLLKRVWVTLVETEPVTPARIESTGWTRPTPIATQHLLLESYRTTPRNTILFGTRRVQTGERGPLRDRRPDPPIVADIVRGFRARFPSLRDVMPQRTWGGWIAMTPSMLPVAGQVTSRIMYAIGCNGHGLAQAPYLGTLLANRIADGVTHDDLQVVWRDQPRFTPSPISEPALQVAWAIDRFSDRLNRRRLAVVDDDR